MKNWIFYAIILFCPFSLAAQQVLSADEAVALALKNNFDILIASNDASVSKINNSWGNAGFLPTAAITATDNLSINNLHQKLSSGAEINANNASFNTLAGAVALNWTLFDGGKMFVTKRKLNEIQALGELQYKDKLMQAIYNVLAAYYDIVRQKRQLVSINEVIVYNQERVKLQKTSFEAGLLVKTNYLQSQIDLNVNLENAVNQQTSITAAKRSLNLILSRDPETAFEVPDTIPTNYVPDKAMLQAKMETDNAQLNALKRQIEISKLIVSEAKSSFYPRIGVSAGYGFQQNNNSSSTLLQSRTYGPQLGASLSIPLFQAGSLTRQIEISKIQQQNAEFQLENAKVQVNTQLRNALSAYDNQRQLLEIETSNAEITKENLEISMHRLRLGQTTALEVRQAQESYVDSHTRLINFKYNLKLAEAKLKMLISNFQ